MKPVLAERLTALAARANQVRSDRRRMKSTMRSALAQLVKEERSIWSEMYDLIESIAPYDSGLQSKRVRDGKVSKMVMEEILRRSDGECEYCGRVVDPTAQPDAQDFRVIDHLVPRWAGGPAAPWNLVVSCRACDTKKGAGQNQESVALLVRRIDDLANERSIV